MHDRKAILVLLLLLGTGCISTQPRMTAEEWFNQESQRWVNAVSKSCEATHQNYLSGHSPVDCSSKVPGKLRMDFPDKDFFLTNEVGVAEYLNAWCVAVMNRHGNNPTVEIHLREENVVHGIPCKSILQKVNRRKENQ